MNAGMSKTLNMFLPAQNTHGRCCTSLGRVSRVSEPLKSTFHFSASFCVNASNRSRLQRPNEEIAAKPRANVVKYQNIVMGDQLAGRIKRTLMTSTEFRVCNNQHKYFMECRYLIVNQSKGVLHGKTCSGCLTIVKLLT